MYVFPVFVSTFYVVILIHKMYKSLYIKYQLFSDQYNNASNMIRYNLDPIYATVSYENYKYIPVLMWKWKRKIHSTQKLYVKLIGVLIKDFFLTVLLIIIKHLIINYLVLWHVQNFKWEQIKSYLQFSQENLSFDVKHLQQEIFEAFLCHLPDNFYDGSKVARTVESCRRKINRRNGPSFLVA